MRYGVAGLCECGCGEPAPIAKWTNRKRGWVKGQPLRFVHGHAVRTQPHTAAIAAAAWRGRRHTATAKQRIGYALEHRLVMAARIGRPLQPAEVVHHVNEQKDDNRPENLWLFPDAASHNLWHRVATQLHVQMPAVRL